MIAHNVQYRNSIPLFFPLSGFELFFNPFKKETWPLSQCHFSMDKRCTKYCIFLENWCHSTENNS